MQELIKIGNAQGFWGDQPRAAATLISQQPDLDYLTLDYLAEVSLSIMAIQQEKDSTLGYARDFIEVIDSLIPFWNKGLTFKVVSNAGGLNPIGCAEACQKILQKNSKRPLKIGIVAGDNVLDFLKETPQNPLFANLDTNQPLTAVLGNLVTANAYLGAASISKALKMGADIVITGRTADPSLTVGPCLAHFGWELSDYHRLAGATIAGHLIECSTQVTGGISTNWLDIEDPAHLGFPVTEIFDDGSFVITKPSNSSGTVNLQIVKEQLLYEIGDPDCYLSPDVTVSFLSLVLENQGKDRVFIKGAQGKPPPSTYKVSATYKNGFKAEAFLAIFGPQAVKKGRKCGEIILQRVKEAGFTMQKSCIECLGSGDVVRGVISFPQENLLECVLRIAASDPRYEALECFSKEIAPLVTSGPQGVTGYTSGRPHIRPIFGYWPCLIPKADVNSRISLF